jgi:hypothetical protein
MIINGHSLDGDTKAAMQNTSNLMISHAGCITKWLSSVMAKPGFFQGQIWDIRTCQVIDCSFQATPIVAPAVELYRQINNIWNLDELVSELQDRIGLKAESCLDEPEVLGRSNWERRKKGAINQNPNFRISVICDQYGRHDHEIQVLMAPDGSYKMVLPLTAFAGRGEPMIHPHYLPPQAPFQLFNSNLLARCPTLLFC